MAPSRRAAVDAIILAFEHSQLSAVSGSLRSALDASYSDLVQDGTLDLDVLWELLEDSPGFDESKAKAPLCAIKSWEDRFGMPVSLPQALSNLSDAEVALVATQLKVPPAAVRRAFGPTRQSGRRPVPKVEVVQPRARSKGDSTTSWRERKEVAIAATAVLIASAAIVSYTLFGGRGGGWETINLSELTEDIPLRSARQLGTQLGATLADQAWLERADETRTIEMRSALVNLQSRDIEVFYVADESGKVRAIAQWYGDPPEVRVTFPNR